MLPYVTIKDAMQKDVWAIFHHRYGNHADCPEWCPVTKCGDLEKANKHTASICYGTIETSVY